MIRDALTYAILMALGFLALGAVRGRWRDWKDGRRGLARLIVEALALVLAGTATWIAMVVVAPDNLAVGLALAILAWYVLALAWAETDERLARWERPPRS